METEIIRSEDGNSVLNKIKIIYSVNSIGAFDQNVEAVIVVTS